MGPPFTILENNTAAHTTKLEKREECTISNGAAKLGAPAGMAVRRDGIGGAKGRRNGVVVCLGICIWWVVDIGVHGGNVIQSVGDAVIKSQMYVVKDMQRCLHVPHRWLMSIRGEE